jgi:hypothetical protein
MSGNIHWSPEEDARLRYYVGQGQPWGAIAVLMDATYATIHARAKRLGLTRECGLVGRPPIESRGLRNEALEAATSARLHWLYGLNHKTERAAMTASDLAAWNALGSGRRPAA